MRNFIRIDNFLLALIGVCLGAGPLVAQHLLYNNGAAIYVQSGAEVYVQGGVRMVDTTVAGPVYHAGLIDNSGLIQVNANFLNDKGGELILRSGSTYRVGGNWHVGDTAIVNAMNGSWVVFNGGAVSQAVTHNIASDPQPAVQWKFNQVRIATDEITLPKAGANFEVRPGGNLQFMDGGTQNVIRTGSQAVVMEAAGALNSVITYSAPALQAAVQSLTGGAAAFDNNYIDGNLAYQMIPSVTSYRFPVGDAASLQYFELNFTGYDATELDSLVGSTAGLGANLVTDCNLDLTRYTYEARINAFLDGAAVTSTSASIYTANFAPRNVTAPAGEYGMMFQHNGAWEALTTGTPSIPLCAIPAGPYQFSFGGFDRFSGFGIGFEDDPEPLPVNGLALTAQPAVNAIQVNWGAQSETNNFGYQLERSIDGQNFTELTWKAGAGTTAQPTQYAHLDAEVEAGVIYYYRAKQVDFDGRFSYSNVAEAMLMRDDQFGMRLYPNPFNAALVLDIHLVRDEPVTVRFYDAIGKLVLSIDREFKAGTHQVDLGDLTGRLALGTYNCVVTTSNSQLAQKVVRVH